MGKVLHDEYQKDITVLDNPKNLDDIWFGWSVHDFEGFLSKWNVFGKIVPLVFNLLKTHVTFLSNFILIDFKAVNLLD